MKSKGRLTAVPFDEIVLASMRRITVILDFRSPSTACGVTYADDVDGRFRGIAIPRLYPSREPFHRIGTRKRASWPSNALEDEAQIIGGRTTHGDKTGGGNRRPRPPAAHFRIAVS
jgi:hypothetical protein